MTTQLVHPSGGTPSSGAELSAVVGPASGRRVLTGDRPTGRLHLGHYFGTVATRVELQRQGHDVMLVVADYQVITDRDHPGDLRRTVLDLVLDYLGYGLDPTRTTIFCHSAIPALNQLVLPFLSLVTEAELVRNPTVKDEIASSRQHSVNGLMLCYPVHQAADILFCDADTVPVGRDQLPHLELTRSIARRFNRRYSPVFTLPDGLLSDTPRLAGLDGRKMGKSAGNAISPAQSDDEIAAVIKAAPTDSERRITHDPSGRPGVAALLALGALCSGMSPEQLASEVGDSGSSGLKRRVTEAVVEFCRPVRARRAQYSQADAAAILSHGNAIAHSIAESKLADVRAAMGMNYAE